MEHPVFVESYSMQETADALGKSYLSIRKWVSDGILPPPILRDTVRNINVYSVGELLVIRRELRRHEAEFSYLCITHDLTINRIWQAVQGYRSMHI